MTEIKKEWVSVLDRFPDKNQVVFVRLSCEKSGLVKIKPIKPNAVYDHSENKWLMYSTEENSMVEIQGTVTEWRIDRHPLIEVCEK